MLTVTETTCPGCGLSMPSRRSTPYGGCYNTSSECWSVYTEVLGAEFGDTSIFGRVHQLTVDTYAVQHAGNGHHDKSIAVHLAGLHHMLVDGVKPSDVAWLHKELAGKVVEWPSFDPPVNGPARITVFDVAMADNANDHVDRVHAWAHHVWDTWSPYHPEIAAFISQHI